eukprot:4644250-Amphidinium_carterae.1
MVCTSLLCCGIGATFMTTWRNFSTCIALSGGRSAGGGVGLVPQTRQATVLCVTRPGKKV